MGDSSPPLCLPAQISRPSLPPPKKNILAKPSLTSPGTLLPPNLTRAESALHVPCHSGYRDIAPLWPCVRPRNWGPKPDADTAGSRPSDLSSASLQNFQASMWTSSISSSQSMPHVAQPSPLPLPFLFNLTVIPLPSRCRQGFRASATSLQHSRGSRRHACAVHTRIP